jgi:beta-lactamase class A
MEQQSKKSSKLRKIFLVFVLFAIGFSGGVFLGPRLLPKFGIQSASNNFLMGNNGASEVHQGGYKYINPILECNLSSEISQKFLRPFENKIDDYIQTALASGDVSHVSVYFRDLNNGPWFGISENEDFHPSSLLKVTAMLAAYLRAEKDPAFLSKEIEYDGIDTEIDQYYASKESIQKGHVYTVEELIEYMIKYSDNAAALSLAHILGTDKLIETYTDLGVDPPTVQNQTGNFMSVKDYASFFRILYNASYLNREYSEKALDLLTKVDFSLGLVAGVPKDVPIAHKFGERPGNNSDEDSQLHDCGIVYLPGKPYLLCVMTRANKDSLDFGAKVIGDISKITYEEVLHDTTAH